MRRPLLILLALLLAGVAVFLIGYGAATRWGAGRALMAGDDLAWLRMEFGLGEAEMARVRLLHEGYLPRCREFCARIAARKGELRAALAAGSESPESIGRRLEEIGSIRTQCQAAMLLHFEEVSRAMPPEQGRRYLDEMRRLTLDSHQEFERSMSHEAPGPHGHH